MTTARVLFVAAGLALAAPAAAQLSNRSIAVESGLSLPADGGAAVGGSFALGATTWLEGPAEAIARVSVSSAPGTAGRGPARALAGTLGVRLSLLPDPLRPQLTLEIGWARVEREGEAEDRLALGAGAGLEWFPARDVSVSSRVALRWVGTAMAADLLVAAAAYF